MENDIYNNSVYLKKNPNWHSEHSLSYPHTLKKWDSINELKIILSFEEEFNLKFTKDEIESMVSIDVIKLTIESYH